MRPGGAIGFAQPSGGCPNHECEHDLGQHDAAAVRPVCSAPGCNCGTLPRVFVTPHHVWIEWPECPHGLRTTVLSLGTYLDDVLGWSGRMPADVVELVPGAQPPEPG